MWANWKDAFDALGNDTDTCIARVAETGVAMTSARMARALEQERLENVRGL